MNPFKVILALALAFVFAYLVYASWQTKHVPKTIDIGSPASFKSIPATVCKLSNDTGTIGGTLHVFHDAARFDITSTAAGLPVSVHMTVSRENTAYYWVDGEKNGSKGDYAEVYNRVGLGVITGIDCKPWWLPNGALFIVPQDVSFPR
jgi:hypothetical protein